MTGFRKKIADRYPASRVIGYTWPFLLFGQVMAAPPETTVSFSRDLVPIFRDICATCHLTGEEPGNLKLYPSAAYASLVNVQSIESPLKRVQPGKPAESYVMHKLDGTHMDVGGQGERMPFGQPQLDEAIRDRIRAWINAGAKKN